MLRTITSWAAGVWHALDTANAVRHGAPMSEAARRRHELTRQRSRSARDPLTHPLVGSLAGGIRGGRTEGGQR